MKASKFSEAQIAFVLNQAEGDATVAEVCRKAGVGVATFYNWREKYADLMPSEMKRPRLDLSRFCSVSLNGMIAIKEHKNGTQTQ